MSTAILTNLDFGKNQALNLRAHVLATAPSSPVTGQIYYDSDDNKLYWWNNSQWVAAEGGTPVIDYGESGDIAASAPGHTADAGALDESARADHRHPREAWGLSGDIDSITFGQSAAAGGSGKVADASHAHEMAAHDDAAHNTVELSDLAAPDADFSFANFKLTNLGTPTAGTDAANKDYVDNAIQGLDPKASVRVATTAAGTLASSFENNDTIDGITLATGDRILIKDQAAPEENGIYTVNASGAPTRALDANSWGELISAFVWVEQGTANADTGWVCTVNAGGTLNTTSVTFVQFTGAAQITAGNGLTKTGNTLDVGQGTGISVAADAVAVDTAVVARKYSTTIGDGAATSFNVDHNLNSTNVVVMVRDTSSGAVVIIDITVSTVNRVIVSGFAVVPSSGQYTVVVIG